MSLVINSNLDNSAMILANREGDRPSYPDFNQILIKPNIPVTGDGAYFGTRDTDVSFPADYVVKSVNGTPINFWSTDIIAPLCFSGLYNGDGYGSHGSIRFYSSQTADYFRYRVGFNYSFPAGRTVGKNIFCMPYITGSQSTAINVELYLRVGLLHTDGTISYCGSQFGGTVNGVSSSSSTWRFLELYQENTGLITQEGDILIVEIYMKQSSNKYALITFGRDGGSGSGEGDRMQAKLGPKPIQVSVE